MGHELTLLLHNQPQNADCEFVATTQIDDPRNAPIAEYECTMFAAHTPVHVSRYIKGPPKITLTESHATLPRSCARFRPGTQTLVLSDAYDCVVPLNPHVQEIAVHDTFASSQFSIPGGFNFHTRARIQPSWLLQIREACPLAFAWMQEIAQHFGMNYVIALTIAVRESGLNMRADHGTGLGLGQATRPTWRIVTSSPQFQRVWKIIFGDPAPAVPGPGESMLADMMFIFARIQRVADISQIVLPPPATQRSEPPPSIDMIMAANLCYAYPAMCDTAHTLMTDGLRAAHLEPGLRGRLQKKGALYLLFERESRLLLIDTCKESPCRTYQL